MHDTVASRAAALPTRTFSGFITSAPPRRTWRKTSPFHRVEDARDRLALPCVDAVGDRVERGHRHELGPCRDPRSPFAVATAIRTPVNEPGPTPTPIARRRAAATRRARRAHRPSGGATHRARSTPVARPPPRARRPRTARSTRAAWTCRAPRLSAKLREATAPERGLEELIDFRFASFLLRADRARRRETAA